MKNKFYTLFLLLFCMATYSMANTDNNTLNETSFNATIETNTTSDNAVFFTDPVINCPSNITRTASSGQNAVNVTWSTPSATTPCTVSNGETCSNNTISGFKYLGKYGNSKYYCSNTEDFTYWQAKQGAAAKGGYLAVICSSGENNFLSNALLANQAWIGLSDAASEGHFRWENGSTCSYKNWASGEPNNEHNTNEYHGADHTILSRHDGKWRDRNGSARYEYIMEIPCTDGTRPGNVSVSQIAGPSSGSAFAVGSTTTITYRATDECGRSKTCSFTVKINAPADPCANQGGDSDGDGVCDNQDNCRFTPNSGQADNDGDGIGNACDDTPNGEPCANQGGDSDGDGVCDNQDNCRFNANPDQADNDGDGIGNACDDTPNGGGGGPTCNDATATGGDGKITINNLAAGAIVDINGAGTGWVPNRVCSGNCNSMEMLSGLSAGSYTVTIQTFDPYCAKRIDVTVTGGGGNPCDNQGGDSDGDGVCDNVDNCQFTPNSDQADNDGDGIGNACDDTPNGGGGGGSCNDATATGGDGKITVNSLASGAKVEINGPGTGWVPREICSGNCSAMEMVSGLSAGAYTVTVQTFSPYCYKRIDVTVTGGGGNPCDNQGGDTDGDGVCDNVDNCRFTANSDQADNDGDGIGNVCDDTPNGGGGGGADDCKNLGISGGDGKFTVSGIKPGTRLEYLGAATGYALKVICDANCGTSQMVTGLAAGSYTIKAQTFNPYCYAEYTVTVTGGGGNPCDNQGGDSDGDGVCDNQDNCRFTPNSDQADNDGDGIGNACDDTPNGGGGGSCNDATAAGGDGKITVNSLASGAKVEINGPGTGWVPREICSGNCSAMEMVSGLSAGAYTVTVQTFSPYCYKRIDVTVTGGGGNPCDSQGGDTDGDGVCDNVDNCRFTPNSDQADNDGDGIGNVCDDTPNGGGGITCDNVNATTSTGKITVSGLDAPIEIVTIFTQGYQIVDGCNNNCNDPMMFNVQAGTYIVDVKKYTAAWVQICDKQITVTVPGVVDPCAGQGGDSDGDGVCDNQDNCKFTPNADQADNDGDGIGNVCDDTPNGNPCAGQGGDSDGDGVCDNQDNCKFTPNADQADNDGDGIGNACDDTPNGDPVCADRTVSATTLCSGNNQGTKYGGYLLIDKSGDAHYISSNFYDFNNGKFVEYADGTARLTGRWVNKGNTSVKFDVDIQFSGRTRNSEGKEHNCLHADRSKFYYYTTTTGVLTGRDAMAGARISVSRESMPFQVGIGANVTHNALTFGASGWLKLNITSQPNNGINIHVNTGSSGQGGDININLSGNANACVSGTSRIAEATANTTALAAEKEAIANEVATDAGISKVFNTTATITSESEVSVYPNPVGNELFIKMAPFSGKKAHVLLTNQYGQVVTNLQVGEVTDVPVRIEMNTIPNGLYILTIRANDNSQTVSKKIIVGNRY